MSHDSPRPHRSCVALLVLLVAACSAGHRPPRQPPDLNARVGIDPRLGNQLPLEDPFLEADGTATSLRRVLASRPTLLVPGYYECPNLCEAVRANLARAIARSGLVAGREFNVALLSIDARETPTSARNAQRNDEGHLLSAHVSSWHYLTAHSVPGKRLLSSIGFRVWFDARNDEYAHPASLVVLSPRGVITQYLPGLQTDPHTLRLALVDASEGRLGTWLDHFVLLCCDYDPSTGHYSLLIDRVMQCLGAATVIGLGGLLLLLHRREALHGGEGAEP